MKFIRVNMSDKSIKVEDVPQAYANLGGRGLTSIMINEEVPPACDPLGPENMLIFAPGFLSGTPLVNTSRISVGAKSPLTGGIKESNAGGSIGAALGHLGITAIIVEGQPPEGDLSLLVINSQGEASLVPADEYKGLRTYALAEQVLAAYGDKNAVMCIGPAGEYQLASASIQSTDVEGRPCRAAGRGGMGAVMGSKGLKALVVAKDGKSPDVIVDKEAFKEAAKVVVEAVKADPMSGEVMPALGTASLVAPVNAMGAFPSYNATKGQLEGWEKISGETMAEIIKERGGNTTHRGCDQCMIHCSNEYVDADGKFITGSLEYETIWATGGMTGILDLDVIARLDNLCDDIGLDTMNTGVAVAVAMDAGYREFGDAQAAIDMIEEIGQGTEFGRVLGNGPAAVGEHFNHHRVPAVKRQSIAAYDPRGMLGNGITYATSPMGADHTAGNAVGAYLEKKLDPLDPAGQVETSRFLQTAMAAFDSMGQCFMASVALLFPEGFSAFRTLFESKSGLQVGEGYFPFELGQRILTAEKDFNRKAGLTAEDDRLPKFFYEEPLPPHNKVFPISDEELDSVLDFNQNE